MKKRRIFQWFTATFALICICAVYANVIADDDAVRKLARSSVNQAAGCGESCKLDSMRGERGMVQERIEYDVQGHGHWVVICRRAAIIAGDYACQATEAK